MCFITTQHAFERYKYVLYLSWLNNLILGFEQIVKKIQTVNLFILKLIFILVILKYNDIQMYAIQTIRRGEHMQTALKSLFDHS